MLRKLMLFVALAATTALFAGCTQWHAPEPKTYKVESIRVIGTTAYVEAKVTKTKISVTYTCDTVAEKDCAVLQKGSSFSAIAEDGKLTKVDKQ